MLKLNSLKRSALICYALEWKEMTKKEIMDHLWDKMNENCCESTIEKTIYFLRNDMDAPIEYNRYTKKYYISGNYSFTDNLINLIKL